MNKAVAVYFSNGIGNLIMMTPAFQALKELRDGEELHVFVDREVNARKWWDEDRKRSCVEILNALSFVDRVIEWPDSSVDLDQYSTWWATPHADRGETWDLFIEKGALERVKLHDWFRRKEHEVEHYLGLVMAKGWMGDSPPMVFPLNGFQAQKGERMRIGFCNSHYHVDPVWVKRRWPHYGELGELAKRFYNAEVICIGSEADRWWLNDLDERKIEYEDHVGKRSIIGTGKVIAGLDVLVTTDTSALHIASALKIPVIALFGPSGEAKNGPWMVYHRTLVAKIPCVGCRQRRSELRDCQEEYPAKCMREIWPSMVMAAIRDMRVKGEIKR